VPSLVVSPDSQPLPTILFLHGGAYISGSAYGYRAGAGALATAADAAVLVPDYRLAPEHPFPAALDDSHAAYLWLLRQVPDPGQITIVGDSSGAGLALSLALTLKSRDEPLPAAVVLQCPALFLAAPIASDDEAERIAALYLGDHPRDDPIIDPLTADLHDLPQMLIQAATGDGRLADAKALGARAREQGVDVRLELYPVDAHGFHLFWSFLPEAADAIEAAGAFIRRTVGAEGNTVPRRSVAPLGHDVGGNM
jgi:acetyl esterase/lipase